MKVKSESEVAQLCPTLSDPRDCSLPGSSIHGISQARVLEWGAIASSWVGVRIKRDFHGERLSPGPLPATSHWPVFLGKQSVSVYLRLKPGPSLQPQPLHAPLSHPFQSWWTPYREFQIPNPRLIPTLADWTWKAPPSPTGPTSGQCFPASFVVKSSGQRSMDGSRADHRERHVKKNHLLSPPPNPALHHPLSGCQSVCRTTSVAQCWRWWRLGPRLQNEQSPCPASHQKQHSFKL